MYVLKINYVVVTLTYLYSLMQICELLNIAYQSLATLK
jgi:hypothetical protein